MKSQFFVPLLLVFLTSACGPSPEEIAQREAEKARIQAEQRLQAELAQAQEAKAAAERAEEARLKEEAKKAEAERIAMRLSNCCQAIAQRGFADRSMADMAGKKACLAAHEAKQEFSAAMPAIREALGERELPEACTNSSD